MPNSKPSFLKQSSEKETPIKLSSKRYTLMEDAGEMMTMMMGKEKTRKRVMVVVDQSLHSKHAMLWALTHVANKGDMLTLLHIQIQIATDEAREAATGARQLVSSLGALCKACKPEVQVEGLVIEGGEKVETVVSQVKKLEVSVLVLGQKNSSPFLRCFGGMSSTGKFVEQCIDRVECLTIGVRKQSKGIGGYLISTRWRKDFWLLA